MRLATDRPPDAGKRSSTLQMQLLALLIDLTRAARILEIGCFTGYGTMQTVLLVERTVSATTLSTTMLLLGTTTPRP